MSRLTCKVSDLGLVYSHYDQEYCQPMRNCSKSSKMVSLCLGLKIGLGHFLNIDIMTLVLGFELDWLVLKFIHMCKMWKVVGPCI